MNLHLALSVLLSFCAACYLLLGARLIRAPREAGSVPMGAALAVIGIWVFSGAIELVAMSYPVFMVGRVGHFIGTAILPVVTLVCFREYTGYSLSPKFVLLLLVVPVITVFLAATNTWHELMWVSPYGNEAGDFLTRTQDWGWWRLYVHVPYSYLVLTAAIIVLLIHSSSVARAHKRGMFLLAVGTVPPLLTSIAYGLGFGPNTLSIVPIVFAVMLPYYAWLVISERIVEFSPLALETVFQNMLDPVVVVDDQNRVIGLNHGAEKMLDVLQTQALREPLKNLFGEERPEVFAALETGAPQRILTSTGRYLHLQVSNIDSGRSKSRGGRALMFRDVSDVEKAQADIRNSEVMLRTLLNQSANGIVRLRRDPADNSTGRKLTCIFANAAAARFLDTDSEQLINSSADEIFRRALSGMTEQEASRLLARFLDAANKGDNIEADVKLRETGRLMHMTCEPIGDEVTASFIDITESRAKERQIQLIASTDPLTGVLNRGGFEREATAKLSSSEDDATGALLFIDLNEFKQINDSFGHEIGDQLLTIAAERLNRSLRSCDIVGRPGGDEFVALVPDVNEETAGTLAARLTKALVQPYVIGEKTLKCAASIGMAFYPSHANTLTGLLREADQAMYRAKARSRGVVDADSVELLEKAM